MDDKSIDVLLTFLLLLQCFVTPIDLLDVLFLRGVEEILLGKRRADGSRHRGTPCLGSGRRQVQDGLKDVHLTPCPVTLSRSYEIKYMKGK